MSLNVPLITDQLYHTYSNYSCPISSLPLTTTLILYPSVLSHLSSRPPPRTGSYSALRTCPCVSAPSGQAHALEPLTSITRRRLRQLITSSDPTLHVLACPDLPVT